MKRLFGVKVLMFCFSLLFASVVYAAPLYIETTRILEGVRIDVSYDTRKDQGWLLAYDLDCLSCKPLRLNFDSSLEYFHKGELQALEHLIKQRKPIAEVRYEKSTEKVLHVKIMR